MNNNNQGIFGSHENFMEFTAAVNVVQNHHQIKLQKATVAEQQYTNFLMEQQAAYQNQQELQRQKEKLIDLWCRELEHQGMSPLKAYGQAMSELELQQIFREVSEIFENYSTRLELGYQVVVQPELASKDVPIVVTSIFGFCSAILAIAGPYYWAIPITAGFFYWTYTAAISKRNVDQELLISRYKLNLTRQTQQVLEGYLEGIENLPKSRLFDDKSMRKILKDFLAIDVDAYDENGDANTN